ncbi:STAS-like domain-containing protein [Patescibacteria group bacterium]|nr:STAS-like domain-containing protein [Patescibacteria group bacterium]
MRIALKKFGTILIARSAGKEAFLAFQPSLKEVPEGEKIEVDFEGVKVLTPSWADEFLTPLKKKWKVNLLNTKNSSIEGTLRILERVSKI